MKASMPTVLIPCAGFGKRVGEPPAKELLKLPSENNPLIHWCLDLTKKFKMRPVLITRKDKKAFLEYIETIRDAYNIELCLIDASKEWPDTLLKSDSCWTEQNIVLLPDTRFSPDDILPKLSDSLKKNDLAFATFSVPGANSDKFSCWGVLKSDGANYWIAEKPRNADEVFTQAWGLFAFKKEFGVDLLTKMLESNGDHEFKKINTTKIETFSLDFFQDVTRDKTQFCFNY